MERGLIVEYLYHDDDIVELRVSAANEVFAGSAAVYVARGELRQSAEFIRDFPTGRSDKREVVWGAFGTEFAGGATRLLFDCIDGAMHSRISVQIEDADALQSALVRAVVEPAAVDTFLPQLLKIDEELGGRATLAFAR